MLQITGITQDPAQQMTVSMPDGTKLLLGLQFWDQNYGWYFTGLNWNNGQWIENGRRVVSHPNMLRNYRFQIPFGIACFTIGDREPTQIQDFASGASSLYILTAAEVLDVEKFIQGLKIAQV
ncbi:MAG TPA: hypothetical protein VMT55_00125 [Candidatus Sulfotelmatobacter sp.]|nr:hypothetical protein [Candidatus Sulfotelmatobacter sp.]